jgi:hypothetical protein
MVNSFMHQIIFNFYGKQTEEGWSDDGRFEKNA